MQGSLRTTRRKRQSPRRQFKNGRRNAAVRAFTGAQLVRGKIAPTVAAAAERCGSTPAYVQAALAILAAENTSLVADVVNGRVPLLATAREVKRLGELVAAYRKASAADRVAFARAVGPTVLFDTSLVPAL
jgi:hypothetical protein